MFNLRILGFREDDDSLIGGGIVACGGIGLMSGYISLMDGYIGLMDGYIGLMGSIGRFRVEIRPLMGAIACDWGYFGAE